MKITLIHSFALLAISLSAFSVTAQDQSTNEQQMPPSVGSDMTVTPQHFVWDAAMMDMKEIQAGQLALQKSDNADLQAFAEHMISNHTKACKKLKAIAEKEGLKFPDTNSLAMNMDEHWNGSSYWNSNREENPDTNGSVTLPQTRGGHVLTNMDGSLASDEALNTNSSSDTNSYTAAIAPRGQDSITNPMVSDPAKDTNDSMSTNTYVHVNIPRGQDLAMNMENNVNSGMQKPEVRLEMLSGTGFDRAYAAKMVKGHEQAIRKFEIASTNLQDADLKKYAAKMLPTLRAHLRMAQELQAKVGKDSNDASISVANQDGYSSDNTNDVDNSGVNQRDRDNRTPTPFEQGNSTQDIQMTKQIRQYVVNSTNNFSLLAQNIKIITRDGQVTLRGPVKTVDEKSSIDQEAKQVAGTNNVDDLLEVKNNP